MNPLVWLSLPVLITAVAAVVLARRGRQDRADNDDVRLARVRHALHRTDDVR